MQVILECNGHRGSMRPVLFWISRCRSRFPLRCEYGCQMHVPGPSREMRLAYSTVSWQYQSFLAILITVACTLSMVGWDAHADHGLLNGKLRLEFCWRPTPIPYISRYKHTHRSQSDNSPPRVSLRFNCCWHDSEQSSCRVFLVDT